MSSRGVRGGRNCSPTPWTCWSWGLGRSGPGVACVWQALGQLGPALQVGRTAACRVDRCELHTACGWHTHVWLSTQGVAVPRSLWAAHPTCGCPTLSTHVAPAAQALTPRLQTRPPGMGPVFSPDHAKLSRLEGQRDSLSPSHAGSSNSEVRACSLLWAGTERLGWGNREPGRGLSHSALVPIGRGLLGTRWLDGAALAMRLHRIGIGQKRGSSRGGQGAPKLHSSGGALSPQPLAFMCRRQRRDRMWGRSERVGALSTWRCHAERRACAGRSRGSLCGCSQRRGLPSRLKNETEKEFLVRSWSRGCLWRRTLRTGRLAVAARGRSPPGASAASAALAGSAPRCAVQLSSLAEVCSSRSGCPSRVRAPQPDEGSERNMPWARA